MSQLMTHSERAPDVRVAASPFGARPAALRPVRAVLTLAILVLVVVAQGAAQEHSNPWLLTWIPAACCVTNDCCWEVTESDLRSMPEDKWQVVATGQVRDRTGWSPDGKFYRCACDYDTAQSKWIKHLHANTRCVFVPMRSAALSRK